MGGKTAATGSQSGADEKTAAAGQPGASGKRGAGDEAAKLGDTDKILLFFGFIRKYKGLDILLEAMADPRIRAANIKLLIAGEFYEDAGPYREQIERLGIGDLLIPDPPKSPADEAEAPPPG